MPDKLLEDIIKNLKNNPIIPCTNLYNEIFSTKYKNIKIVLLHDIGILDLIEIANKNINAKKHIILNLDTLKGISSDEAGGNFLKNYLKIDFISSASPKVINCFKKLDFITMQSMFILDTKSLKKGIELINSGKPNFIDIRPGILYPKSSNFLRDNFNNIYIICSGFIDNKIELEKTLEYGAIGITTSAKELWNLYI